MRLQDKTALITGATRMDFDDTVTIHSTAAEFVTIARAWIPFHRCGCRSVNNSRESIS